MQLHITRAALIAVAESLHGCTTDGTPGSVEPKPGRLPSSAE